MKRCEKYNMKKAFEEKCDFDFCISMVLTLVENGSRITKVVPVHHFTLFAVTVCEAQKIAKSICVLPQYICTITLIKE